MPAPESIDDAACRFVVGHLLSHLRSRAQRLPATNGTLVVLTTAEAGVGDQLSSFLGALTVAVGTGRRLEVLPDGAVAVKFRTTSYLAAGFDFVAEFDAAFTGPLEWAAAAQAFLRSDAFLGLNRTTILTHLPRMAAADWGVTATLDLPALAGRLLIPSPSGKYPPMHPSVLTRPVEFLAGGNVGTAVFRAYFERQLRSVGALYRPQAAACALRRLLRPSAAVHDLIQLLRPRAAWPEDKVSRPHPAAAAAAFTEGFRASPLVGVHIRAEAHLLNRAAWQTTGWRDAEAARYIGNLNRELAADRVFAGCGGPGGSDALPGGGPRRGRRPLHLANFSEFWLSARAAARWLEGNARDHRTPGGGDGEKGRYLTTWLVVTDAPLLKSRARAAWPRHVATTSVVPTQVGACGLSGGAGSSGVTERRTAVLQTVAELFLLSEAHFLILGRSRYPLAALLLSHTCRQSLHLFLDRHCRRRRRASTASQAPGLDRFSPQSATAGAREGGYELGPAAASDAPALGLDLTQRRKALRCIGTDGAYSARRLQDRDGRLLQDGMLSNF